MNFKSIQHCLMGNKLLSLAYFFLVLSALVFGYRDGTPTVRLLELTGLASLLFFVFNKPSFKEEKDWITPALLAGSLLFMAEFSTHFFLKATVNFALITTIGVFCFATRKLKPILRLTFLACLVSLIAYLVSYCQNPTLFDYSWYRPSIGYSNTNFWAILLASSILVFIASCLKTDNKVERILCVFFSLTDFYLLIQTESRTSLLATAGSLVIFAIIWTIRNGKALRLLGFSVCAVLAGIVAVQMLPSQQQNRFTELLTTNPKSINTLAQRIAIWEVSLDIYSNSSTKDKLLGLGTEHFINAFTENATNPKFAENYRLTGNRMGHQHNLYVYVLYSYGAIGLILFLLLLSRLMYLAAVNEMYAPLLVITFTAINGLAEVPVESSIGAAVFFLAVGYVVGQQLIENQALPKLQ